MIIAAWNVGHQTSERAFRTGFLQAVSLLLPDILILNEYVHGQSRDSLMDVLDNLELKNREVSVRINNHNQVLIASKFSLKLGELRGVPTENGGGESNFLHVLIEDFELELIGIRVPSYEGLASRRYWDGFLRLAGRLRDRRVLLAGDFNADPRKSESHGDKALRGLHEDKWGLADPKGDRSYRTGTRIDHALLSPKLPVPEAEYCLDREGVIYCGLADAAVADHAPLILTFDDKSLRPNTR